MTPEDLSDRIHAVLDRRPRALHPLSGGDISRAWSADFDDGTHAFVKHHPQGARMFEAEAMGLRWIAQAQAVRVPEVLACDRDLLILEYIESAPPADDSHERMGRGLAALHQAGASAFGGVPDNFIATLAQSNVDTNDWATFYAEQRLRPVTRECIDRGQLPASFTRELDAVLQRLPQRCGPTEPPARLHGDLWSGNAMFDRRGTPVLFDPSVHGGHREIDLAMMQLFGGFSARTFAAYDEAYPRSPQHEDRVELYQLYPVLVHVALFGGGYANTARRIVRRYS